MVVTWIPQPVLKYCLGKTLEQCIAIDFCIRTTTKTVAMCRNLGMDVARLPPYPADVRPRRVLSLTLFAVVGMPGFDGLLRFFESAPKETLERISPATEFRAKIKFTRTPEDDDFKLVEVLSPPR